LLFYLYNPKFFYHYIDQVQVQLFDLCLLIECPFIESWIFVVFQLNGYIE